MSDMIVSVCVLSYNHEKYLRDCLDGIIMQQTTFPIEVWVHDDASTDLSQDIIKKYQKCYPDIIKPILQQENQYSKQDGGILSTFVYPKCTGKYIALCEGDDYWTDPHKLQKQVDFLEANPEYGICYTDYNRLEESSHNIIESMFEQQNSYRPVTYEEHLLRPGYLAPMTWLYRRELLNYIASSKVFTDGTYAYMLEFLHNSKVAYLPITTATYRSHAGSASSPIGATNLYKYSIGVFRTQVHYLNKYSCSEEFKIKVLLRGYLSKLPIAIMANQDDFVQEAQEFMNSQGLDIDLIIKELKQGEMKKNSYAYRLGKKILWPLSWLKNKLH